MMIVSGGQTGVDRAALDFALDKGMDCGGWCPQGRLAEDGMIDEKYPLKETFTQNYSERTEMNVKTSDGTLILYENKLGDGSRLTIHYAKHMKKPVLKIKLQSRNPMKEIYNWLEKKDIETLNVAGPRESFSPGIYQETYAFLEKLFEGQD